MGSIHPLLYLHSYYITKNSYARRVIEKTHFSIVYLGSLKLAKVHVYLIFNATAFMRLIGFG